MNWKSIAEKLSWVWGKVKPLVKKLEPAAKQVAIWIVTNEGDRLQMEVREAVIIEGPTAIDRIIDLFQARTITRLESWTIIPEHWRKSIAGFVQEYGDELQAKLKEATSGGALNGVDRIFDTAQEKLIAKIQAL